MHENLINCIFQKSAGFNFSQWHVGSQLGWMYHESLYLKLLHQTCQQLLQTCKKTVDLEKRV
jgi:hypothetical protein